MLAARTFGVLLLSGWLWGCNRSPGQTGKSAEAVVGSGPSTPASGRMSAVESARAVPAASSSAAASAQGQAPSAPAPLACLAEYYLGRPVLSEGRWWLELPDQTRLIFDDQREKTFEQRLATPDLSDMFHVRYRPGPIVAVTDLNHDPGRFRVEALFRAAYGQTRAQVQAQLVSVVIAGQTLPVHQRVVARFRAVAMRLEALLAQDPELHIFLQGLAGTFNWRTIAGTDRLSAHAFGISLDLNTARADYWRWRPQGRWHNRIPQVLVDAFEAEGFIWGGRWGHFDTMHFEYRPELLDPKCWL